MDKIVATAQSVLEEMSSHFNLLRTAPGTR